MVEIKSSGSQCLGTGMTPFFFLDPSSRATWMTGEGGYLDDTI
ncbi:hypothetical protein [Wolbachia endosymbiont (group A) of Anomoia purmunda]|nr:hypothetical protein [Wolbachia endosymbiont (group A) of Anomoia purmunda]